MTTKTPITTQITIRTIKTTTNVNGDNDDNYNANGDQKANYNMNDSDNSDKGVNGNVA